MHHLGPPRRFGSVGLSHPSPTASRQPWVRQVSSEVGRRRSATSNSAWREMEMGPKLWWFMLKKWMKMRVYHENIPLSMENDWWKWVETYGFCRNIYVVFTGNGDISFYQRGLLAMKHITHRDKYYEGPEVTFYDSTMEWNKSPNFGGIVVTSSMGYRMTSLIFGVAEGPKIWKVFYWRLRYDH